MAWPSPSKSSRTITRVRSNRSRARPRASAASSATFSRWARGRFARSTRFDSGRLPKTAQLAFSLLRAARETVAGKVERILRSEEHTSELQSHSDLVCRLLLEKKKKKKRSNKIK